MENKMENKIEKERSEAFEFGRRFFQIVRDYRGKKEAGQVVFADLVQAIQDFTGLDKNNSLKLARKVHTSDNGATALCEANKKLTKKELTECLNAPNFRRAILKRNRNL